jgi:hypothetical protein
MTAGGIYGFIKGKGQSCQMQKKRIGSWRESDYFCLKEPDVFQQQKIC